MTSLMKQRMGKGGKNTSLFYLSIFFVWIEQSMGFKVSHSDTRVYEA